MALNISDIIDIHTHILPGVDDGPKTIEESAALAKCYADMGVKTIIATSHFIPGTAWAVSSQLILEKIEVLKKYIEAKGIALAILPGMEIAFHKKLPERLAGKTVLPLANSTWYLLEPSFTDSADDLLYCLENLIEHEVKIILAHPERIPAFQEGVYQLSKLVMQGMRLQINTGSLLGKFGSKSRQAALDCINSDCVHYLASDAHGIDARRPPNTEDWAELEKMLGVDLLRQLCCVHPAQLLHGEN